MHRFKGYKPTRDKAGFPKQFDTARFSIPARAGAGDYIIHYVWRGYRDCIDVEVQPAATPVAPTSTDMYLSLQVDPGGAAGGAPPPAITYAMAKTDHCQYLAGKFTLYTRGLNGVGTCHPVARASVTWLVRAVLPLIVRIATAAKQGRAVQLRLVGNGWAKLAQEPPYLEMVEKGHLAVLGKLSDEALADEYAAAAHTSLPDLPPTVPLLILLNTFPW